MSSVPVDFADEKEHRRKLAEAINGTIKSVSALQAGGGTGGGTIAESRVMGRANGSGSGPATALTPSETRAVLGVENGATAAGITGDAFASAHPSASGAHAAINITASPIGGLAATNVQAALQELDAEKAIAARAILAGSGLSGGGDLTTDRTLSVSFAGSGADNTAARSDHAHAGVYATAGHDHAGVYQPADATLTALAGVTTATDKLIYATAADTFATTDLSATARTLLDDADAAAMRTTIGAAASGHDHAGVYQPADAELTALAGLTSASDKAPYFTGSGTAALMDVTSAARTVLDDTTTGAMLTTLGAAAATHGHSLFKSATETTWSNDATDKTFFDVNIPAGTLGGDGDEVTAVAEFLVTNNTGSNATLTTTLVLDGTTVLADASPNIATSANVRVARLDIRCWRRSSTSGQALATLMISAPKSVTTGAAGDLGTANTVWTSALSAQETLDWSGAVQLKLMVKMSTASANYSVQTLRYAIMKVT